MKFQWDWDKKELVAGEEPKEKFEFPVWLDTLMLPLIGAFMYVFIQYVAPFLGHLFFGGFL